MSTLRLEGAGWRSPPVIIADTFLSRLRGLRPRPRDRALLIATSSVHGMGMREPLRVVALDSSNQVISIGVLGRGRIVSYPEASAILELPLEAEVPQVGTRLSIVASCPEP